MAEDKDPPSQYSSVKRENNRSVAVAIKHDEGKPGGGPGKIVATGRGKLADEILQLAFAKGVKVREDADLAELLVKLDLDTPIPSEAIVAVAEILAKVYEANARAIKDAAKDDATKGTA